MKENTSSSASILMGNCQFVTFFNVKGISWTVVKSIIELVKAKLNYLRGNSSYLQNEKWGDLCDNAYKMLMSKAKRMRQEERKKKSKK